MRTSGLILSLLIFAVPSTANTESLRQPKAADLYHGSCPLAPIAPEMDIDQSGTLVEEASLTGLSLEGGIAQIYRLDGMIKFIRATLYGETGRTEFTYQFGLNEARPISVKVLEESYTEPLSNAPTLTAATSTHQFMLCDRKHPNFPRMYLLGDSPQMAIEILERLAPRN